MIFVSIVAMGGIERDFMRIFTLKALPGLTQVRVRLNGKGPGGRQHFKQIRQVVVEIACHFFAKDINRIFGN